jgi:hypothetical protein
MTVYVDGKGTEEKVPNLHGQHSEAIGHYNAEAQGRNGTDGWSENVLVDARNTTSYIDFTTGEFTTSDVPDYAGAGNYLYMAFAMKGNRVPNWGGTSTGETWIEKPAADPNKYQLYVLEADAQNSNDEYFRLFYPNDSGQDYGYFANTTVWKETVAGAGDVAFNASKNTLSVYGVENY